MAIRLDVAKDYLVSVAERTLGIRAYRESMYGTIGNDNQNDRFVGGVLGAFQLAAPAFTRAFIYSIDADNYNKENLDFPNPLDLKSNLKSWMDFSLGLGYVWGSLAGDVYLAYLAVQASHNPAEFVALKLAANAATHVGLDVVSVIGNRMKTFRPTATTFAI